MCSGGRVVGEVEAEVGEGVGVMVGGVPAGEVDDVGDAGARKGGEVAGGEFGGDVEVRAEAGEGGGDGVDLAARGCRVGRGCARGREDGKVERGELWDG